MKSDNNVAQSQETFAQRSGLKNTLRSLEDKLPLQASIFAKRTPNSLR